MAYQYGDIELFMSASSTDGDIALSTEPASDLLYLGNDTVFGGVTVKVASTGSLPNGVSWEYWNGLEWCTFCCVTSSVANLDNFGSTTEGTVSWNVPCDWQQSDVYGEYYYWVRVESNTVSGTDTAPVISYIGINASASTVSVGKPYAFGYVLG